MSKQKWAKILHKSFILGCVLVTAMHGYCKYSFIWYDFGVIKKNEPDRVACLGKSATPFSNQKKDYEFIDSNDKGVKIHRSVKLNRADRRHIRRGLSQFNSNIIITEELIAPFFNNHHRIKKEVVGWVLQDFKRANKQATVGQVRSVLQL